MIELTFKGNTMPEVFESMKEVLGLKSAAPVVGVLSQKEADKAVKEESQKEEEATSLTMPEIKKMTKAKIDEGKSKDVKALLAEIGVKRVGDLVENQFKDFSEKLEAL